MYLTISAAGWYLIGASIFFLVLFGFFFLFYVKVKQKQNEYLINEQKIKNQYEQTLLQTQLEIQEQTLKTISQEIHDNIGQILSLAKLNLNTTSPVDEATQLKIKDTKVLVGKAINDLRDLSRSLHGDKIAELGLIEAINNELKILENTGQFKAQLKIISANTCLLDQQKNIILFRILQEAINNIIKHAKATTINVELNFSPVLFTMHIIDDGTGFDEALLHSSATGIGLKSMRSRAALIGGTLFVHSSPGNGTTIKIQLPISS